MDGIGLPVFEPGTEEHAKLLTYLKERLDLSERSMGDFHPRWRVNERKMQAYVSLGDYERLLDIQNKNGKPPKVVSLVMPYSYAVVQTIVTYLLHTFCGRQPIFQVGTYNGSRAVEARNLEVMLQYNCDHSRMIMHIYNLLMNSQVYQFGAVRVGWANRYATRTRRQKIPQYNYFNQVIGETTVATKENQLIYSGNEIASVDPFNFFPDPNVPMTELNRYGEFVFWRQYRSYVWCQQQQAQGVYKFVEKAPSQMPSNTNALDSDRARRSAGQGMAGAEQYRDSRQSIRMVQVDEGTVELIPQMLGLGESTTPEKWLFTILNKETIVRMEPLEADHNLHPICVVEPNALGEAFGSISTVDVVGPVQDHMSWLVNSHMQNVRGAINNRLIVNPHYVQMEDLKKDVSDGEDDGSWIVRLKQSAFGVNPKDAVFQLAVQDVTSGHLKALENMIRMGHMFAGINDNLMGLQDSSGRKTATEVRTSGEAAASRLAAVARVMSAQGLADIPQLMGMNLQQRCDVEFYNRVLGQAGAQGPFIKSEMDIAGDFYYPINDGTLPLDRALMLQVWQQILMGVAQDPELRANYSLTKLFAYVADLGGARNIESFKTVIQPDAAVQQGAAAGDLVPLEAAMQGMA